MSNWDLKWANDNAHKINEFNNMTTENEALLQNPIDWEKAFVMAHSIVSSSIKGICVREKANFNNR